MVMFEVRIQVRKRLGMIAATPSFRRYTLIGIQIPNNYGGHLIK